MLQKIARPSSTPSKNNGPSLISGSFELLIAPDKMTPLGSHVPQLKTRYNNNPLNRTHNLVPTAFRDRETGKSLGTRSTTEPKRKRPDHAQLDSKPTSL